MKSNVVANLALSLSAVLCAAPVRAVVTGTAPPQASSPACPASACRTEAVHARLLAHDQIHDFDVSFPPAPYVDGGEIVIFPGETLVFRFSGSSSDAPGTPAFVKQMALAVPQNAPPTDQSFQSDTHTKVEHDPKTGENYYFVFKGSPYAEGGTAEEHLKDEPPNTMIVSYHQAVGHPDMILRVEDNFSRPLKYDAEIQRVAPAGSAPPEKTSTCPVMPLLAGSETWPYPLGTVKLANFRFVDVSAGMGCE